jgi:hypothetical protein
MFQVLRSSLAALRIMRARAMLQAGKARIVAARRPVRYPQIERLTILCLCLFIRAAKNQYWRIVFM